MGKVKNPGFQWTAWVDGVVPARTYGSTLEMLGKEITRLVRGHMGAEYTRYIQTAVGEVLVYAGRKDWKVASGWW